MYVIFLAGGIGSGKSTVSRCLQQYGAVCIDLDQLSREVLAPGSPLLHDIASAFGPDLLDASSGELNRSLLAQRAFATSKAAERLEALELPAIRELLWQRVEELRSRDIVPQLCVIEVPLLDRMADELDWANEVVVVWCPIELRRARAVARGMTEGDFDARAAKQPSDDWLREHATTLLDNTGTPQELECQVRQWLDRHEREGWS